MTLGKNARRLCELGRLPKNSFRDKGVGVRVRPKKGESICFVQIDGKEDLLAEFGLSTGKRCDLLVWKAPTKPRALFVELQKSGTRKLLDYAIEQIINTIAEMRKRVGDDDLPSGTAIRGVVVTGQIPPVQTEHLQIAFRDRTGHALRFLNDKMGKDKFIDLRPAF